MVSAGRLLVLLLVSSSIAPDLAAQAPTFQQISGHIETGLEALGRGDTAGATCRARARRSPWRRRLPAGGLSPRARPCARREPRLGDASAPAARGRGGGGPARRDRRQRAHRLRATPAWTTIAAGIAEVAVRSPPAPRHSSSRNVISPRRAPRGTGRPHAVPEQPLQAEDRRGRAGRDRARFVPTGRDSLGPVVGLEVTRAPRALGREHGAARGQHPAGGQQLRGPWAALPLRRGHGPTPASVRAPARGRCAGTASTISPSCPTATST